MDAETRLVAHFERLRRVSARLNSSRATLQSTETRNSCISSLTLLLRVIR